MSQAAHTTHSPPPTDPWVPLLELRAAFAGSRKRVERWWAGLESTARRRDGRRLLAHRDWARLPDGRCVSAFLAAAHADLAGLLVPPGFAERAAPSDVARFLALTEARAAVEALRRERGVSRTVATNQVCAERAAWLRAVQVTVWGRPHTVRLPATPSALRLALARVTPGHPRFDGGLDRRGRRTAAGGAPDPRFAESLVSQLHAGTSIRFSSAYRFAAGEALRHGWGPPPGIHAARRWYAANYPPAVYTFANAGERVALAECVAKGRRDYTDAEPLDCASLDGHELNLMLRFPDHRRGWVRGRAVLTGVLDVGTRYLGGFDVRRSENWEGILAGVKMFCREVGVPRVFYLDNGSAYGAALGSHFRGRVQALCDALGAQLLNALPHAPWSKIIESFWRRTIDNFERYFWCFWGTAKVDRPPDAQTLTRARLAELPTLDEVRELYRCWLAEYHSLPHGGTGMDGLSPQARLDQASNAPRRRIDEATLSLLCSRLVGGERGRVVRRDGVSYDGRLYGGAQPEVLLPLLGRRVWLRLDAEHADTVVLCDAAGEPLRGRDGQPVLLSDRAIAGATQADVREQQRLQRQALRSLKQQAGARDWLLRTTPQQIMAAKALHARARLAAERAARGVPVAEPPVTLVRPDLAEVAAGIKRQRRRVAAAAAPAQSDGALQRLAAVGAAALSEAPAAAPAIDYDRIARRQAQAEAEDDLRPDWARAVARMEVG